MSYNTDFTKLYKVGDSVLYEGISATVKAVYVSSVIIAFNHNPRKKRVICNPDLLNTQY